MQDQTKFLSLYDYLGKAAGGELGKKVSSAAFHAKVKQQTREVSNPKYTGVVQMYPKDFLDAFFREPNQDELDHQVERYLDDKVLGSFEIEDLQ